MRKAANELMTGIMVVVCIAILLGLTLKVTGLTALKKGHMLKAQFNYASGIKKGAPVYLTGVEVGEVRDVAIQYTDEGTKVTLTLKLDEGARVRGDSRASIVMMGLMGEKYLELTSGSKDSPFLQEGSLIIGKEPMPMDEIMDKAVAIADNLNAGIDDLRRLTKNVDSTFVENRSQIDQIIENMNATSVNFKDFSEDIKNNPWKLLIKTKEKKEDPGKKTGKQ